MLTIFAIPKAFKGQFDAIQHNAIRSWVQLDPKPEVVLFGDDEGTAEIANELGLRHIPEIAVCGCQVPLPAGVGRVQLGQPLRNGKIAAVSLLRRRQIPARLRHIPN